MMKVLEVVYKVAIYDENGNETITEIKADENNIMYSNFESKKKLDGLVILSLSIDRAVKQKDSFLR